MKTIYLITAIWSLTPLCVLGAAYWHGHKYTNMVNDEIRPMKIMDSIKCGLIAMLADGKPLVLNVTINRLADTSRVVTATNDGVIANVSLQTGIEIRDNQSSR